MTKGLVIIGYQGIGKSSLAGWNKCVDLESSNFFVGNKRADDWYTRKRCDVKSKKFVQGYCIGEKGVI